MAHIVCSAVVMELPNGVFMTMMPRAVAADRSTLSTPMPAIPITFRRSAAAIIFSVTNGALEDVELEAIREWESEFHEFLDAKHADLMAEITEKQKLDDALTERLQSAIDQFKSLR